MDEETIETIDNDVFIPVYGLSYQVLSFFHRKKRFLFYIICDGNDDLIKEFQAPAKNIQMTEGYGIERTGIDSHFLFH
jgi:hypothetical protein